MAFKDLEEGILEEFSSYAQHNGYLRANEDRSFRVKKRTTANKAVASWCVVQCRLCATEHGSLESLRAHFAKHHAAVNQYIKRLNLECQAAKMRAAQGEHTRLVLVQRMCCVWCRRPFGSACSLRLHQRNHHPLEHDATAKVNRSLLAYHRENQKRGARWWWSYLAPEETLKALNR